MDRRAFLGTVGAAVLAPALPRLGGITAYDATSDLLRGGASGVGLHLTLAGGERFADYVIAKLDELGVAGLA